MPVSLALAPHPLLHLAALTAEFAAPLHAAPTPSSDPLRLTPPASLPPPDDGVRATVRDLLRHGGFKPTGRSKPSSEYLVRAAEEGWPAINPAVDASNVVSLRSGIPISVVDLAKVRAPLRVAIAPAGARFVFNAAGQEIDVGGLLCLSDAEGPCANAVKDAQRTKTDPQTTNVLVVLWGHRALAARVAAAAQWAGELLAGTGARVAAVECVAEAVE